MSLPRLPEPIELPFPSSQTILACGAHSKSSICLVKDGQAYLSAPLGNLEDVEAWQAFQETIAAFETSLNAAPTLLARDLHPEYLSTKYAQARHQAEGVALLGAQHHHAHIAACLAEHGVTQPVIGVAFDGLGYGADGQFWGGEFLIVKNAGFRRAAHLEYVPMPGGTAAIAAPWRMAFAYLDRICGDSLSEFNLPFLAQIDARQQTMVTTMLRQRFHAPLTSSAGRLFDAVSALLGVCLNATYEGEAAINLQRAAEQFPPNDEAGRQPFPFHIAEFPELPHYQIQPAPMLLAMIDEMRRHAPIPLLAARFHATVAAMILAVCQRLRRRFGLSVAVFGGGVFQNRLLREQAAQLLQDDGFTVLLPRRVPFHDGSVAFGQAAIAAFR